MKHALLLLAITLNSVVFSQTITWEDPVPVSIDGQDNNRPRIILDQDGSVHVFWGRDADGQLFHNQMVDGEWDAAEMLLPEGVTCFTADWAGPDVGSFGDHLGVVFKRMPENTEGAYLIQSFDGGATWSDTTQIDLNLPEGFQTRMPSVAIGDQQMVHVSIMSFEGNYIDPEYIYTKSNDGGESWSAYQAMYGDFFSGEACDCCMADIAIINADPVIAFRDNEENIREIKCVKSESSGDNFESVLYPDLSETYANYCFSSGPHLLLQDGIMKIVYKSIEESDSYVTFTQMDLSDESIIESFIVLEETDGTARQNNPRISGSEALDFVVWEESQGLATEVLYAAREGGAQGGSFEIIDTLNVDLSGKQINPDVKVDGLTIHTVWQDKGNDLVMYRKGTYDPNGVNVEESLLPEVSAYPNPTNSSVNITGVKVESVQVFDLQGRMLVNRNSGVSGNDLDVSMFPKGTYNVVVNAVYTIKLVVN
ncbi:T9SS type A sorting domain-containing protein [Sanyastnella coralliicola]|uniref:T9SS type A sorting domain-containing protein n=1 Tax=Sanyastnella coralliicola TaxID=3069118 RepID=UPI0027BACA1F|nr:T9SS type A sorting domain-containing protein [Longitalea sp. SCSIO 12813]